MGYYTHFDGEITIEPPLTWKEVKGSPFAKFDSHGYAQRDCKLRVVEEEVEADDGTLMRKYADAVIPNSDGQSKSYNMVEHLQELLNTHAKGHAFKGYISAEGEEAGDLWRLCVVNGQAVKVKPAIIWPEMP